MDTPAPRPGSAAFFVDGAVPTAMLSGEGQVGKDPAQKARTLS